MSDTDRRQQRCAGTPGVRHRSPVPLAENLREASLERGRVDAAHSSPLVEEAQGRIIAHRVRSCIPTLVAAPDLRGRGSQTLGFENERPEVVMLARSGSGLPDAVGGTGLERVTPSLSIVP